MDDKSTNGKKPLRQASNKIKDLYNAYLKNEDLKTVLPDEKELHKTINTEEMTQKLENAIKNSSHESHKADSHSEHESSNDHIDDKVQQIIDEMGAEMEQLEFKIDDLEKERDSLKDQLLRKSAEMENFRRRSAIEKQELLEYGNTKVISRFLEIPDDLGKALEVAKKSQDYDALLTGFEMIYNKSIKLFEELGVKKIDNIVGNEFDVNFHEALMMTPHPEIAEGNVVQVVQDGYMAGEKVLRHAKVITSAGKQ